MSAFEKIGTNRQLQDHWVRRLIAGIIDSIIVGVIAWLILPFLEIPGILLGVTSFLSTFPFLSGILFFLYALFFESYRGATIGKQIMNLKVTTTQGNMVSFKAAMIRNLSKIHGLLWVMDTLIGMGTVGTPFQKFSDRFTGTTVKSTIARTLIVPNL